MPEFDHSRVVKTLAFAAESKKKLSQSYLFFFLFLWFLLNISLLFFLSRRGYFIANQIWSIEFLLVSLSKSQSDSTSIPSSTRANSTTPEWNGMGFLLGKTNAYNLPTGPKRGSHHFWLRKRYTCRPATDIFLAYLLVMSMSSCLRHPCLCGLSQVVTFSRRTLSVSNDIGYQYALTLNKSLDSCWDIWHFDCHTEHQTPPKYGLVLSRTISLITSPYWLLWHLCIRIL